MNENTYACFRLMITYERYIVIFRAITFTASYQSTDVAEPVATAVGPVVTLEHFVRLWISSWGHAVA
jgi:hypothetical protein